ncbi:hypothetical protein WOLCODRAFT_23770 [Wolfiporia cocos MD-104 SS10]|uniref:Uncharacterized protein n=1 Tax=Wolfiporia cocos (strain MD-104) TaxID=742152 RepID=A0A2H3JMG3_WOLCO|nr:hypothetical protein WOLCODRAFT_23770 [Wolfiporia cocos MD-104 SS10]
MSKAHERDSGVRLLATSPSDFSHFTRSSQRNGHPVSMSQNDNDRHNRVISLSRYKPQNACVSVNICRACRDE